MTWKWRFFDDALAIGGTVPSTVDAVATGTSSGGSAAKIAGVPSMIARRDQRNEVLKCVHYYSACRIKM
jgi:hypothetical protein